MAPHFITKHRCCGRVVAQCRCWALDKTVIWIDHPCSTCLAKRLSEEENLRGN